jgi:hypothetical protein
VLLTNSLIGVLPLRHLEGCQLSPYPLAARLRALAGFAL